MTNKTNYIEVWWSCHADISEADGYYRFRNNPLWETMDIGEWLNA